jgi:membrane-associated phospholipid phosphatase
LIVFFKSGLICILLLAMEVKTYSDGLQKSDSVNTASVCFLQADTSKVSNKIASGNFYKTDSIFSFKSQKGYFPSLIHNLGEQVTAPLHFNTKQWLITGAAIGVTIGLTRIDGEIDDQAKTLKQKYRLINKVSPIITDFGSNSGILSVVAIGSVSAIFKNKKGVQTSLLATQAMITSGIWVHLIKTLTGRERPESDYLFSKSEAGKWYGPFAQYDQDLATRRPGSSFDSFPSGHTITAFSIATVFAMQYKDIKAIPIISYSAATLVGLSRLTEHKHWASDVFAGAFLGYLCGRQVVNHFNKLHQEDLNPVNLRSRTKAEINLVQHGNQIGFTLTW